ncbi:hypothetical protein [Methanocella arvoryzae]|uniref:Uncharacterized protein n=1 Tax=Methanocella arvoryzae (strain DSM 22066 / NBRC 105507 / MRE50) TaxID=351160 RepID=Q0W705_METAR|nr:hypothetical protein [Methanocella arvoryzae]CAJ35838.1 hypothetical protein RCIX399 [Methanocella arvoryzae MRE50]
MSALTDIALTDIAGIPLMAWLGLATLIMMIATATYGYLLFKGKIKGSIFFHRNLAIVTISIALAHTILAASLFM